MSDKLGTVKLVRFCELIFELSQHLPTEALADIIRVYQKTWSLVVLVTDGLAVPHEDSFPRLQDLWRVMDDRLRSLTSPAGE